MGSWDEEFDKVLAETLAKKSQSGTASPFAPKLPTARPTNYMQNKSLVNNGYFAPVAPKTTVGTLSAKKKKKWYETGLFEDGYDFGDVSKTILGVNDESASIKDLTVNSFKRGYYNSVYGEESYDAMLGRKNNKDAYKNLLESDEYQFAPGNDFAGGVSGAFELLGQQYRQFTNPRTMAYVGTAVSGAILAGNAGPQALAPEEIVTVPAAAAFGFTTGSSQANLEIEAGHAYNELIESGISEETARKIATGVGSVNAGLEALQVDELVGAFKVLDKTGATDTVTKKILKELVERGVDVAKETGQEVLQEGVTIAGVQAAHKLDKGEVAYTKEDVANRLWDTAKSSALSFGMMNVPATMKNTASIISDQKKANLAPINQPIKDEVKTEPVIEAEPDDVEQIIIEEQPATEVKPKRVLYTGSPNTNIQQFKVGGADGSRQTGDRYGRGVYLTTNEGTAKNYAGDTGRVYQVNADDVNIFDLNETITPEMQETLRKELSGADKQVRNSMLRNFRTEMEFDDFKNAEKFFMEQQALWKEQDGEYSANKPEIKSADHETGKAVIEFTDFANWENNISNLTGNQLYDALKSISTDDFSSFITGHGFDGISFNEDADNQQYVIYRNEDRLRIDNGEMETVSENSTQQQETQLTEENSTVSETENVADSELTDLYDQKQVLEDTLESLTAVEDFGENHAEVSKRLDAVNENINALENQNGAETSFDRETVSSMLGKLMEQDSSDSKKDHQDFYIDGFLIERFNKGDHYDYSVVLPDGSSVRGQTAIDKSAFYADLANKIMTKPQYRRAVAPVTPSPSASEQSAVPADAPYRVVPTKSGNVLEKGTFDAPQKQTPKQARVLTEMPEQTTQKPAKKTDSLDVEPKPKSGKINPLKKFAEYVVDNGFVFERLGKKTNNRELEAKWDGIRRVRSAAQHLIGEGMKYDGVKSLKSMMETVDKAGLTQDFYNYLAHYRNVDGMTLDTRFKTYNRGVFGNVSAEESQFEVNRLESLHPEFKAWAEDVYAYNNYLRDLMVKGRLISQKTADLLAEMYPHYVPIHRVGFDENLDVGSDNHVGVNSPLKSATGGNQDIKPLFETMAERTMAVYKAVAMNNFGLELYNTLYPGRLNMNTSLDQTASNIGSKVSDMDVDYSIDGFDPREELLQSGTLGSLPTFSVFIDGERHTFDINEEMYTAMKPTSDFLSMKIPVVSGLSNLRRNLITAYSPWFTLKNAIKDFQEIIINSQHPLKTYATLPEALMQLSIKGTKYQEYVENGGEHITYFDTEDSSFDPNKSVLDQIENSFGLKQILKANNFIETLPRLAEFIASRSEGRSVEVSMLDAARVTTNFGAGGKLTKLLDRNGCTFLNSSVQGFTQQVRNVVEAKQNGLKGWAGLAARYVAAGLPAVLLNNLLWDDDEDYQDLPDYISNNYYIVAKYGDGQFVRIPKGRTAAVIQNAIEQVAKQSSGDDEADWKEFFKLFMENIAPNNPLEDNILAPIIQTATNTTWYGEDIIPYRLKDLPAEEQFDEKTDAISIWLGEKIGKSPKKINYLLDQYSGVVGDTVLPYLTPKAESPIDSPVLKAIAPLRDIFTTDSTLNNRVTGDFYETLEEVEAKAESPDATPEDKFLSSYLISTNAEVSKLMQQQREIQTSDKPDSEKYRLNKELKEQINELQKKALEGMDSLHIEGNYAEAGGKRFNLGTDSETKGDRWFEIKPTKADGTDNKFYLKEQAVTHSFGVSYKDYWNNKEAYDDAFYIASGYDNEDGGEGSIMETVKNVFGVDKFASFAGGLADIKADYDDEGNAIKGSRKKKLQEYISGLDIPAAQKYILYKAQYNWDNSHNYEILDYLNGRNDIDFADKLTICEELGFTVGKDGRISWD